VSAPTDLSALGDEAFVSLTTYRRNGDAVSTPVWVARDGDSLVVTTAASTGKMTRRVATPRVAARALGRTRERVILRLRD